MSRPSAMPSRNLTLTEELEKLEQSITLTLQEIDHNFSKAHRIVTSSIIPVVEQYARHSDAVWEGSKFWKSFFEASANVSLSGYEENAEEDETALDETQTTQDRDAYGSPTVQAGDFGATTTPDGQPSSKHEQPGDDSLLDSPSVSVAAAAHGTPHRPGVPDTARKEAKTPQSAEAATFAEYPSPYEALKREIEGDARGKPSRDAPLATPGRAPTTTSATSFTPGAQSYTPHAPSTQGQRTARRKPNDDPILHRVLDKNYRVQATPHAARSQRSPQKKPTVTAGPADGAATTRSRSTSSLTNPALDSSPFSPALQAPTLRSNLFSPRSRIPDTAAPRTPGVSVQTGLFPHRGYEPGTTTGAGASGAADEGEGRADDTARKLFTSRRASAAPAAPSAQEDEFAGLVDQLRTQGGARDTAPPAARRGRDALSSSPDLTPPQMQTMRFALPALQAQQPGSTRLLQTPAREASKRIVEDLLLTAGAGSVTESTLDEFDLRERRDKGRWGFAVGEDDDEEEEEIELDSPSVVRVAKGAQGEDAF